MLTEFATVESTFNHRNVEEAARVSMSGIDTEKDWKWAPNRFFLSLPLCRLLTFFRFGPFGWLESVSVARPSLPTVLRPAPALDLAHFLHARSSRRLHAASALAALLSLAHLPHLCMPCASCR